MDAFELLRSWPGWSNANAEKVLACPAWRLEVDYGEGETVMRRVDFDDSDCLWLEMTLDDEPHRLGLADSADFPDLHALWGLRKGLPDEVLLALVEKECGSLLQAVENSVRMSLSLKGLADGRGDAKVCGFGICRKQAEEPQIRFELDLSSKVAMTYGMLTNLDVRHPFVRSLEIGIEAEYARLNLTEGELALLSPGDYLLVPEEAQGRWLLETQHPQGLRLIGPAKGKTTFGAIVDGDLPALPAPDAVHLVNGGKALFAGRFSSLLSARAVRVDERF